MTEHPTRLNSIVAERRATVIAAAEDAGLLGGTRSAIGVRVPRQLLEAARTKTGIEKTTDIVEYALAKLALEDDFGEKLLARKGSIPKDLDLEF